MDIGKRFDVMQDPDVDGYTVCNHKREINNKVFLFIAVKKAGYPAYVTVSELIAEYRKKVSF